MLVRAVIVKDPIPDEQASRVDGSTEGMKELHEVYQIGVRSRKPLLLLLREIKPRTVATTGVRSMADRRDRC